MSRRSTMTDEEFEAMFAREELEQQCAFVKKWLHGIDVMGVAGGNCGFFLYCNDEAEARELEQKLNKRGLYRTDIHKSYEPECGAWVCQVSERDTFDYTGKGNYPKIVATLKGLCLSMKHQPKYVYVDCNQWLVQLMDEDFARKLAKDLVKYVGDKGTIEVTEKYITTFEVRINFGA